MKLLLFVLLTLPLPVFAEGGLPDKPYIYVMGKAEIQKSADMANLHFNAVARAPDQPKANDEVQVKAKKILALLKERKIVDKNVIAEDLRSQPEFEQDENYSRGHGKLIGYVVTRPFEVKVHDITAFPKLVDELIALGGIEFSGIDGGLSKEKEFQDDFWQKALSNAREQAEKTLKPLGMKIDSVFAVSPVSFPEIESKIYGEVTRLGVRGAEMAERAEGPPEYRLAPVTISQNVHIIYLISPAK